MRTIGYTLGSGVGPELFLIALRKIQIPQDTRLVQCDSLIDAINRAQRGEIQGLVTGPVHKSILQNLDGKSYPGQTELLHAHLAADSKPPLMVFVGGPFVMGLATVHIAVREVSQALTQESLSAKLERLLMGTAQILSKPVLDVKVAVLGLNPHAGEGGLLGDEEIRVITPVVKDFQKQGYQVSGPISADGFWAYYQGGYDAVMAMMHDQGLGPYKLLAKGRAANLTFGLKIPRSSPAHGTADDLVGTGRASPESLITAFETVFGLSL